ncbi:hypothetical protein B9T07_09800 [Limnospira fusiformis CCALA 023]|uniref:HetZ-related protein 2 n=1 Tax=Limnospira platensis TaxID=118562 RepID=UPI00396DBC79
MLRYCQTLEKHWLSRLQNDYPQANPDTWSSVVVWLLGENPDRWDSLEPDRRQALEAGLNFRYRILKERYWGVSSNQAYRNLMQRLGGLVILRQKIQTWVATSRDRQRQVVDVLQEVIQNMLDRDRYLKQQIQWIAQCTDDPRLRNSLLLTTVEEYCLRPIRNQPLLVYRFVNYLYRSQRGGLTQVPTGEWVKQISEEIVLGDKDEPISLLDDSAIAQYQESQYLEEQKAQRVFIQKQFQAYLQENVDPIAAQWLELYLRGYSQEAIAQKLQLPIKQVYRMREKVGYHATRNFAVKIAPELVMDWLGISLVNHRLGLTPSQWEKFYQDLTPTQRRLIDLLKANNSIDAIAQILNTKVSRVHSEWSKIYLASQVIRNNDNPPSA